MTVSVTPVRDGPDYSGEILVVASHGIVTAFDAAVTIDEFAVSFRLTPEGARQLSARTGEALEIIRINSDPS